MARMRGFEPDDLHALYAVSLATGHQGGDASHLYADPRLVGHIYAAPYGILAPELAIVIEDDLGMAGFVVGADDTAIWEARLEMEWWPQLRPHHPDPVETSSETWTSDRRRASMIHHPALTPRSIVDAYPAHIHMNLLPRLQGRGWGSRLLGSWSDAAARRGTPAIHVGINRANQRAVRFWSGRGFEPLTVDDTTAGRTLWMGRR